MVDAVQCDFMPGRLDLAQKVRIAIDLRKQHKECCGRIEVPEGFQNPWCARGSGPSSYVRTNCPSTSATRWTDPIGSVARRWALVRRHGRS